MPVTTAWIHHPTGLKWIADATEPAHCCFSAPESTAAAVLIPSSHKQAQKGDRDQPENNAAEKGFDHQVAPG